jgi:ribosomal protein L29
MKKNDFQQYKTKPETELKKDLADLREKLRKFKFDLAQGKVKDIKEIKETKKNIARILGLLNEKHGKENN